MRVWSSLEMLSSARSFVASSSRSFFSSEERDFFEGEGVSRGDRRGWGGRRRMRVSSRVGGGRRPPGRRPRGGKRRRANRRHGRFGAPRIEIAGVSRSGEETHPRHAGDGGDLHERLVRVQLDLANLLAHAHAHGARRSRRSRTIQLRCSEGGGHPREAREALSCAGEPVAAAAARARFRALSGGIETPAGARRGRASCRGVCPGRAKPAGREPTARLGGLEKTIT